jgi:hypothetical protein
MGQILTPRQAAQRARRSRERKYHCDKKHRTSRAKTIVYPPSQIHIDDPVWHWWYQKLQSTPTNIYTKIRRDMIEAHPRLSKETKFAVESLPHKPIYKYSNLYRIYDEGGWINLKKSHRDMIFEGYMAFDFECLHANILIMLLKRHDPSGIYALIKKELNGNTIWEYFDKRGISKSQAKQYVPKIVYGLSAQFCEFPDCLLLDLLEDGHAFIRDSLYRSQSLIGGFGQVISAFSPFIEYIRDEDTNEWRLRTPREKLTKSYCRLIYSFELELMSRTFFAMKDDLKFNVLLSLHDGLIASYKRKDYFKKIANIIISNSDSVLKDMEIESKLRFTIISSSNGKTIGNGLSQVKLNSQNGTENESGKIPNLGSIDIEEEGSSFNSAANGTVLDPVTLDDWLPDWMDFDFEFDSIPKSKIADHVSLI